jgi:hypothetical protein
MPQALSKTESASASRRNTSSHWDVNPFFCSAEWHMTRMQSEVASALYSWGLRLSCTSQSFHPSLPTAARYLNCSKDSVRRALREFVWSGWAEIQRQQAGKPTSYRLLEHEEWSLANPGNCIERDALPWTGEGDELGCTLYAISGGHAKFMPRQVTALRKFGFPDEKVSEAWRAHLKVHPEYAGSDWKGKAYFDFRKALAVAASKIAVVGSPKNRSNP